MSRLRHSLRFAIAILLACAATLAADPALPQDFPRLGHYGSIYGDGFPLLDATGALDEANLDRLARYDVVTLDASPISEYRADIAAALRARNPDIVLLAYVNAHYTWFARQPDSTVHYPTRFNRTVRDLDGYLYNTNGDYYGTVFQQFANVNMAKRDGGGRYVVAEALADLFYDAIVSTGVWDGVFLDTYCDNIQWMEAVGEYVDFQRAGYPDAASFHTAWKAGTDTLASRLRSLSGGNEILCGNCGPGTKYVWLNGWMRENFPFQNGGNWYQNMFRDPGGYFVDEAKHRQPVYNWIFTAVWAGTDPYSAANARRTRFGLGSASLASGFGVVGVPERQSRLEPYHEWWYDEYGVDLATGQSSTQLAHTGWLGQALAPAYQMIWVGTNTDAVTNPEFETDLSGWRLSTSIGSALSRDTTTAGSGSASALVTVPPGGTVPWSTTFRTIGSIQVQQGAQYAVTFWAKTTVPRTVRVAAGRTSGGGEWTSAAFDLTTAWKRYQIVLIPSGSGYAELQFQIGESAGDVWVDDVHFQRGVTSIWRRDFQNGIVLVNPSSNTLGVPLGGTFTKIAGTVDPATNDGASITQASIPPSDALFLIGSDFIPPADIDDLTALPPGAPGIP